MPNKSLKPIPESPKPFRNGSIRVKQRKLALNLWFLKFFQKSIGRKTPVWHKEWYLNGLWRLYNQVIHELIHSPSRQYWRWTFSASFRVPCRDLFPEYKDEELPGVCLSGSRLKEGMTQKELSELTGIPQSHISEMENGRRRIGKKRAKILGSRSRVQRFTGSRFHSQPRTAFWDAYLVPERNYVPISKSKFQMWQLFRKMSIFNEDFGSSIPSLSLTLNVEPCRRSR